MFAPADLFNPFVNAVALALKRTVTLIAEHLVAGLIVFVVAILVVVLVGRLRR